MIAHSLQEPPVQQPFYYYYWHEHPSHVRHMTGTKKFEKSLIKVLTILLLQEVDALRSLNAVNL